MIVSTRGRYALRILVELAELDQGGYTPMKTIAENQGLSLKYLERILPVLTQNGILEGVQGKNGGYRLCRKPEEYTVDEILCLTEGDLAPAECVLDGAQHCDRRGACPSRTVFTKVYSAINHVIDSVTLRELMPEEAGQAAQAEPEKDNA